MTMLATGRNVGNNMTGKDIIPKGFQKGQLAQFTPEQMGLFQQLFQHVSPQSYLSRLASGDQSAFEQTEAPAMRQFQELQGQLASRFSGAGMGARRSSGFQNVANQATSDFAQDLASRRQALQQQAIRDLLGLGESLLAQRPFESFITSKPMPFWKQLLGGASPGIGSALGNFGGLGLSKWAGLF